MGACGGKPKKKLPYTIPKSLELICIMNFIFSYSKRNRNVVLNLH